MAIALVQNSASVATGTGSVVPTLPAASTAGTLLVANLNVSNSTLTSIPSGWIEVPITHAGVRARLVYYPNNPGGLSSFTFGGGTFTMQGSVSEWSGVDTLSPLETYGDVKGTSSPITATTNGTVSSGNPTAIASVIDVESKAGTTTFTASTNWTKGLTNETTSTVLHTMLTYRHTIANNFTYSVTPSDSSMNITQFEAAIAVFKQFTGGGGTTGQIKVYNGSSFVAKPVKVWNGSSWVTKPVKRWNGSSWVTTTY